MNAFQLLKFKLINGDLMTIEFYFLFQFSLNNSGFFFLIIKDGPTGVLFVCYKYFTDDTAITIVSFIPLIISKISINYEVKFRRTNNMFK